MSLPTRAGDTRDQRRYTLSMLRRLAFLLLAFALILGPMVGMESAAHAHAADDHAAMHAAPDSHAHCDEPAAADPLQVQLCASCPCAFGLSNLAVTALESIAVLSARDRITPSEQTPSGLAASPQPRPPRA